MHTYMSVRCKQNRRNNICIQRKRLLNVEYLLIELPVHLILFSIYKEVKSKKKRQKKETKDKDEKVAKKAKTTESNESEDTVWDLGNNRHVSVRHFKGKLYVDIRELYYDKDANLKPGKKGIYLCISLTNLQAMPNVMRNHFVLYRYLLKYAAVAKILVRCGRSGQSSKI